MKNLILIGGGGHCKACIDVIEACKEYKIHGIIDARLPAGSHVLGYVVLGGDNLIEQLVRSDHSFLVTVGQIHSADIRASIYDKVEAIGGTLATVISPLAYLSKHARIGKGVILMHHAVVNAAASIGDNCIINTKAVIEHDASIGDHCHISTGAIINGNVSVGSCSFIGSQSTTKQSIQIPEKSFIKANQLVK